MSDLVFYTAYNLPPRDDLVFSEETLTVQSDKDSCDINVILAQAQRSGVLQSVNSATPRFIDVSDCPDYATAIKAVRVAEDAFMLLPASLRAELDNDPARFVDFVADPANAGRLEALGLKVASAPAPEPERAQTAGDGDGASKT